MSIKAQTPNSFKPPRHAKRTTTPRATSIQKKRSRAGHGLLSKEPSFVTKRSFSAEKTKCLPEFSPIHRSHSTVRRSGNPAPHFDEETEAKREYCRVLFEQANAALAQANYNQALVYLHQLPPVLL